MSASALFLPRLCVLILLFLWFRSLERRDRGIVTVLAVLSVALIDAVLYPTTADSAATSIFHPSLLGQSLRLTQLVVPVALAARLSVRGWPRRIDGSTPLWIAFFSWVLVETAVGLAAGHPSALVFRQMAIVVHVGGGIALAAGVPARDYVSGRTMARFLQGTAAVATALFAADTLGLVWSTSLVPDLPIDRLGRYGPDAATLFSTVGVLGVALAVSRPRELGNRALLLVPSLLLIISHLASPQRAARLGLYVILLLLALVCATPTARRRVRVGAEQVGVVAGGLLIAVLALVFVVGVVGEVRVPAQGSYAVTDGGGGGFAPRTRVGSIESRYNQWATAREEIGLRPLRGYGLGKEVAYYEVGKRAFVDTDITHNIVIDLLLRTGLVGLVLAAASVLTVWWQAISTWRRHVDDRVAALAVAAVVMSAGLLVKGLVESIFEKHRLALLLGLVLGLAVSATLSRLGEQESPAPVDPATPAQLSRS